MRPHLARAALALLVAMGLAASAAAQPKPVPKPSPALPPGEETLPLTPDEAFAPDHLPVAAIDRVLYATRYLTIIDAFGMGSLRQTGDVYVLLRDGTAFLHDRPFPVTDLDIGLSRAREPEKWFSWTDGASGPVLTRIGGPNAGGTIDLADAQPLLPVALDGPFEHTWLSVDAASGPRPEDNAYRFAADGTVRHTTAALAFATPDEILIRAAAPTVIQSPFRLDGYALVLSTAQGEERHFFAAFSGGAAGQPPPAVVIDGEGYFTP